MPAYEVYVTVEHGSKYGDRLRRMSTAFKLVGPGSSDPTREEQMRCVAYALRDYADMIDPDLDMAPS